MCQANTTKLYYFINKHNEVLLCLTDTSLYIYIYTNCVVGYTTYVCVSTLYDFRTTTKSPNDAFLRTYPRR